MKTSFNVRFILSVMALWASGCSAEAARVTPATLRQALLEAKGGEVLTLSPGDYGNVVFPTDRQFSPRLVIDASKARFTGITIRRVSGVEIRGGEVNGPRMNSFAVLLDFTRNVTLSGMRISGSRIGVSVARSSDVVLLENRFDGMRSDGINVAMSQRVRIERNDCRNFRPIPAIYSSSGKIIVDGDHPDCIQGWSRPGYAPTRDVEILGNTAEGYMQGVFFGDRGQGGYDRITVMNNVFNLSAFNGIVIWEARRANVTGNIVNTIDGSVLPFFPFPRVKAWIRVTGTDIRACNNRVEAEPRGEGTKRC